MNSLLEQLSIRDALTVIAIGTGTCSNAHTGANGRRPPAFLVKSGDTYLLLDCGEGTRLALGELGINHSLITHVAVTHSHPDHSALPQLIQSKYCGDIFTRGGEQVVGVNTLTIYMPRPLLDGQEKDPFIPPFSQVWSWHVPETPKWEDFHSHFVPLDHEGIYAVEGTIELTAFKVHHGFGRHPAMGFRIKTPWGVVCYTGDCGFTDELVTYVQGADLLIADCSTRLGQEVEGPGTYGHMGPSQCGTLAKKAGVQTLWMTHYTGLDAPEDMRSAAVQAGFTGEIAVARDGDVWSRKRSA